MCGIAGIVYKDKKLHNIGNDMTNMLNQLLNVMGEDKYVQNKKIPDLYINPNLKGYGPASFQKTEIDSMINIGERAARGKWKDLLALRRKMGMLPLWLWHLPLLWSALSRVLREGGKMWRADVIRDLRVSGRKMT